MYFLVEGWNAGERLDAHSYVLYVFAVYVAHWRIFVYRETSPLWWRAARCSRMLGTCAFGAGMDLYWFFKWLPHLVTLCMQGILGNCFNPDPHRVVCWKCKQWNIVKIAYWLQSCLLCSPSFTKQQTKYFKQSWDETLGLDFP